MGPLLGRSPRGCAPSVRCPHGTDVPIACFQDAGLVENHVGVDGVVAGVGGIVGVDASAFVLATATVVDVNARDIAVAR